MSDFNFESFIAKAAPRTEEVELYPLDLSDAIDKAADAAKKATGGKFDSQVETARDAADSKLGNA